LLSSLSITPKYLKLSPLSNVYFFIFNGPVLFWLKSLTYVFVNFRVVNIISPEDIPFGLGLELLFTLVRMLWLELFVTLVLV
jgi:hypothetical protein